MPKILIVDDEDVYRRQLEIALRADGHDVQTAGNGREAIDRGSRFRPDILLTDWMLKDDIHGLHVAHVLREMLPELRAILMTGFPSEHLRQEAGKTEVHDFIEKPFSLARVRASIEGAEPPPDRPSRATTLAVLETNARGEIVFANPRAQTLLADTHAGKSAATFEALFAQDDTPNLEAAIDRWVAATPLAAHHHRWYLRAQEPLEDGSRLVVLRSQDESRQMAIMEIEMLLGFKDYQHTRWPYEGRVVVINPDPLHRRWFVSLLEGVGAGCYAVETVDEALRLLTNDEGLFFIVLDLDTPGLNPAEAIQSLRASRGDTVVIGATENLPEGDKLPFGLQHILPGLWRVDDLIKTLTGRIGNCVECGLPLPLRKPQTDEPPAHWECCNCGARYAAVFDDDFPPDVLRNVRPAEPR